MSSCLTKKTSKCVFERSLTPLSPFLLKLMKLLILRRLHLPWLLSNFRLLKLFSMLILLLALVVLWLQIVPSDAAADEASPKDAFVVGSRIELLMPLQLSACRSECC